MAQIWDNEPAGLVQSSACFQYFRCHSSSTKSFLPRTRSQPLSPFDLSAQNLRATLDCSTPLWLSSLYQILSLRLEYLENLPEISSNIPKTISVVSADTTEQQQTKSAIQTQGEAPVLPSLTPTVINIMHPQNSGKDSLASLPSGKDHLLSSPISNSDHESRQHLGRSLSPRSTDGSPLSSPPESDDLNDPFTTETTAPKSSVLKRTIDKIDKDDYQVPTTRAATKRQTPNERRKVHFLDEVTDAKPIKRKPPQPQVVLLEGLDATFKVTKKSVFAKSDRSKELKAWSRNYLTEQSKRTEDRKSREAARLKAALGPNLEGSRASTPASFVSNTPSKRGRGNGRRGRGRGGRGGRGRGGGRAGRNEDSPEPSKKRVRTEAEKEILADLKARQTELKKFFKEVGLQQTEALNLLATRDFGKITKKSKAHEKVPEYLTVLDALNDRKQEAGMLARRKYEYDLQQAEFLLDAEKKVIEQRHKTRCLQAQSEHHAGAQGDYLTAREAIQAMIDHNRTEPGSPDQTRFPRLHSFSKPGMVRGYFSHRIADETSLSRSPSSFDDVLRREVINQEIVSPSLFKALDLPTTDLPKSIEQHPNETGDDVFFSSDLNENPTLNIQALAAEVSSRLEKPIDISSPTPQTAHQQPLPIPPNQQDPGIGSWPLSRLADAAENEYIRMKHPQDSHMSWPGLKNPEPFQPWLGFRPQDQQPPRQLRRQDMSRTQWQLPMQHSSMSRPPPSSQQQAPLTMSKTNELSSHPLPPPPPSQQLQPSPRFIHHHHQQQQQQHVPTSQLPHLLPHQHQQKQPQPQPQPFPPPRPPTVTLHQQPAKHYLQHPSPQRQPQRKRQPRPPTKSRPRKQLGQAQQMRPQEQLHPQPHPQPQPQQILQKPYPVTFVHQTIPPFLASTNISHPTSTISANTNGASATTTATPARAAGRGRKRPTSTGAGAATGAGAVTGAGTGVSTGEGAVGGVDVGGGGGGVGRRNSGGNIPAAPPRGGQRILLPKKS